MSIYGSHILLNESVDASVPTESLQVLEANFNSEKLFLDTLLESANDDVMVVSESKIVDTIFSLVEKFVGWVKQKINDIKTFINEKILSKLKKAKKDTTDKVVEKLKQVKEKKDAESAKVDGSKQAALPDKGEPKKKTKTANTHPVIQQAGPAVSISYKIVSDTFVTAIDDFKTKAGRFNDNCVAAIEKVTFAKGKVKGAGWDKSGEFTEKVGKVDDSWKTTFFTASDDIVEKKEEFSDYKKFLAAVDKAIDDMEAACKKILNMMRDINSMADKLKAKSVEAHKKMKVVTTDDGTEYGDNRVSTNFLSTIKGYIGWTQKSLNGLGSSVGSTNAAITANLNTKIASVKLFYH